MASPRVTRVESPTEAFFADLAARGHEPLVRRATGTLRWDLVDGEVEHWYVTMRGGDLEVARKKAKADAVVRLEKSTFDGMASGTVNALAATLRGALTAEGDLSLLMLFQRLFPSPPSGSSPRTGAGSKARS